MAHPGLYRAGVALFAVMTVALATTAVVFRRREHVLNPLWVASAVDTLAMTYMLLPYAAQPAGVRWIFIAYLACQILAWALESVGPRRGVTTRPAAHTPHAHYRGHGVNGESSSGSTRNGHPGPKRGSGRRVDRALHPGDPGQPRCDGRQHGLHAAPSCNQDLQRSQYAEWAGRYRFVVSAHRR